MRLARAFLIAVTVAASTILSSACSEPPDGPAAFKTAQQMFQHVPQFSVTWRQTTPLGTFTETADFDCAAMAYRYRYLKDLSAKGIADGVTQSQGRPAAHQEEDRLFVDGKSYHRNSSSWENASVNDDAQPNWGTSWQSYDPTQNCQDFEQGKVAPFVPFNDILKSNQIKYVETQSASSGSCYLYQVSYPSVGYSDTMTNVTSGSDSASFRQLVTKTTRATICLDTGDSRPRQGKADDIEFTYSYDPIAPIAAPKS